MLHDLRRGSRLIWRLAVAELRGRYAGSVLGSLWAVLQPLTLIAMYTVLFAVVLRVRVGSRGGVLDFGLFLVCGLLPWNAMADSVRRAAGVYSERAHLLRRLPMPPLVLPAARVLGCFLELGIALALFLGVLLVARRPPSLAALGVLGLVPLQLAMALALGAATASLAVLVRDVRALVESLLTIWFLATPVIYPLELLPAGLRRVVAANPMTPVVEGYRALLLDGRLPPASDLGLLAGGALLLFIVGSWIYRRTRAQIIDHV